MRPLLVVSGLLVFSLNLFAQASPTPPVPPAAPTLQGHIVGRVVNDAGEPIPNARICYGSFTERGGSSTCGNQVDDQGHFDVEVPLSTNRVSAEKPEAGYWSEGNLQKFGQVVRVSLQQPTADIVVKLGAKPGYLSLNAVAKGTGQPVDGLKVRLMVVDEQALLRSFEKADKKSFPVPADKDLLLIVEATGYKRWFYKDAANAGEPILRLQSGEQRSIDAELEPDSAQN